MTHAGTLVLVLVALCALSAAENINNADFAVVGAGGSGCAVAEGLSRDPSVTVVLLESGEDNFEEDPHSAAGGIEGIPRDRPEGLDHMFSKEDLELFPGFEIPLSSVYIGRARRFGGGISVYAGVFQRPTDLDFERWDSDLWTFNATAADWRALETAILPPGQAANPTIRGTTGPLTVTTFPADSNAQMIGDAYRAHFGYGHNPDSNSGDISGVHLAPRPVKMDPATGRPIRQDTCSTLLSAAVRAARPNLIVLTGAQVTRILWKTSAEAGSEPAVDAIEYIDEGAVQKRIDIKTELILSAGAIGTPQLLQLSGVGDCGHLASLGIECTLNAPEVGANLFTNVQVGMGFYSWLDPFYGSPGAVTTGYIRTPYADPTDGGAPDGEISFQGLNLGPNQNFWVFEVLQHELPNTGSVQIQSTNPFADPEIRTRLFEGVADALPLASMIQDVRAFMGGISLPPPYYVNPFTEVGKTAAVSNDIGALAQWLTTAKAGGHKVGTCSMHRVVDAELRVYGLTGVRVVDNSVVPAPNRGHSTAAESALIGAVAGRRIAEEHNQIY